MAFKSESESSGESQPSCFLPSKMSEVNYSLKGTEERKGKAEDTVLLQQLSIELESRRGKWRLILSCFLTNRKSARLRKETGHHSTICRLQISLPHRHWGCVNSESVFSGALIWPSVGIPKTFVLALVAGDKRACWVVGLSLPW